MTSDGEPCSQRGEEPPAETDNGEEVASPKRLRLNVDLDVKPIPRHGDWTLAPGLQDHQENSSHRQHEFLKVAKISRFKDLFCSMLYCNDKL